MPKIRKVEEFLSKITQSPTIMHNIANDKGFCRNLDCRYCPLTTVTGRCTADTYIPETPDMREITKIIKKEIDLDNLQDECPEYFI